MKSISVELSILTDQWGLACRQNLFHISSTCPCYWEETASRTEMRPVEGSVGRRHTQLRNLLYSQKSPFPYSSLEAKEEEAFLCLNWDQSSWEDLYSSTWSWKTIVGMKGFCIREKRGGEGKGREKKGRGGEEKEGRREGRKGMGRRDRERKVIEKNSIMT